MLVEQGFLPKEYALDAIQNTIEVKREIAGVTESVIVSIASIGLLRAVAQSVSAVTVLVEPSVA